MLRKAFFVAAALMLVPALAPSVSHAQYIQQGKWELMLDGTGSNNRGFTAGSFGVDVDLGYFLTNALEVGIRQGISYSGGNHQSSIWTAETRASIDWNFDFGKFVPFVGANAGYVYGRSSANSWELAPEAGVRYFLNQTTFVFFLAEYEFFFRTSGEFSNGFKAGQFVYQLGLGVELP